jgi:hypothetical protein
LCILPLILFTSNLHPLIKEYIKSSEHLLIPIYVKLLNCIFDSGKVPDTWLWGNIIPLFTNKGKSDEPKNKFLFSAMQLQ